MPTGLLPTMSGDYLVMLVVFAAPLLFVIPAVWLWYLVRGWRISADDRPRAPGLH